MNMAFDEIPLLDETELLAELDEIIGEMSFEEKQLLLDSDDLPSCIYEALVKDEVEEQKAA